MDTVQLSIIPSPTLGQKPTEPIRTHEFSNILVEKEVAATAGAPPGQPPPPDQNQAVEEAEITEPIAQSQTPDLHCEAELSNPELPNTKSSVSEETNQDDAHSLIAEASWFVCSNTANSVAFCWADLLPLARLDTPPIKGEVYLLSAPFMEVPTVTLNTIGQSAPASLPEESTSSVQRLPGLAEEPLPEPAPQPNQTEPALVKLADQTARTFGHRSNFEFDTGNHASGALSQVEEFEVRNFAAPGIKAVAKLLSTETPERVSVSSAVAKGQEAALHKQAELTQQPKSDQAMSKVGLTQLLAPDLDLLVPDQVRFDNGHSDRRLIPDQLVERKPHETENRLAGIETLEWKDAKKVPLFAHARLEEGNHVRLDQDEVKQKSEPMNSIEKPGQIKTKGEEAEEAPIFKGVLSEPNESVSEQAKAEKGQLLVLEEASEKNLELDPGNIEDLDGGLEQGFRPQRENSDVVVLRSATPSVVYDESGNSAWEVVQARTNLLESSRTAEVVRQIVDRVETLAATHRPGGVLIRLEPAELGMITLTVKAIGDQIEAHIAASDDRVRTALDTSRSHLAQAMEARGFSLRSITVTESNSSQTQMDLSNQNQGHWQHQPRQDQPGLRQQSNLRVYASTRHADNPMRGVFGHPNQSGLDLWT